MRRVPLLAILFLTASCSDTSNVPHVSPLDRCPDAPLIHTGEATYYTFASGAGACMFDSTPGNLMIGAMNQHDYQGSRICGECVSVTGPRGTVLIRIVDLCPECPEGNIDLSTQAFSRIGDLSLGHIPITWEPVPCDVNGPILYHFKDGSNPWWTAVQIRNHRFPIARLEYLTSQGVFREVHRTDYNYFVEEGGMGVGPYTFRVADIYGHVLVDSLITPAANASIPGRDQFPPCEP